MHYISPSTHTHTRTRTRTRARKDINAFVFSPLNLSNPLIFQIVKYAKVTEVNRYSVNLLKKSMEVSPLKKRC